MIIRGTITGLNEMSSAFAMLPSLLSQMGQAAMRDSLEYAGKIIRDDFLMGPYPQEIERRSGSFRATFVRGHASNIFTVSSQGTTVIGTFGSTDKRTRILNDGGVIRPVTSQYLAVRTEFTKTPRGVVMAKYQQPLRNIPNTFVVMGSPKNGRQGRGTVFEKVGKRIVPIAWLVRYVVIVGRKFMQKGEAKATPGIQAIFQGRVDMVLARFNETLQKISGRGA